MKKAGTNTAVLKPLLKEEKDVIRIDCRAMDNDRGVGIKKWHTMLRIIGPYLVDFLPFHERIKIKTLTKETLGDANLKN
jgi:hypothetical protein